MTPRSAKTAFLIVLALASLLFFFRLGDRSFRNPDEGRYAEIAKEMVQSGNGVEPRLYGIDYLRKPILFYWLIAGSFKLFGFYEWAARLVPALFGILGVLATFFFTRQLFDLKTAFYSSLILATNVLYLEVGRYLLIDMVFSFFLVLSFYLFYLAVNQEKNKVRNYLFFYVSLALAFLAKGPAAGAMTVLVGFTYLVFTKKLKRVLCEMQFGWGVLIFSVIVFPWFVQIASRQPDFLNFFFLHEHVQRFVSQNFEHQEAWWYYVVLAPLAFMPWIFFTKPFEEVFGFFKAPADNKEPLIFALIAVFGVILFYSLSRSKLVTYILPSFPFISILIARGWALWEEKRKAIFIPRLFYGVTALLCVISVGICFTMEKVNANYTTKPFAEFLKSKLQADDRVFIYDHPGAFYDFRFYLDFPVKLVGLEGELELFRANPRASEVSITKEAFDRIVKTQPRIFCLMRKSDYEGLDPGVRGNLSLVKEDARKVLVESRS